MGSFNLFTAEVAYDDTDPEGYRSGMARFGPQIGAVMLGGSVYELPAGQSICPYHYEYPREEWLVVLDGRPTLRRAAGEDVLERGDIVCFPPGPEGAHKVTNTTDATVRVLMLSTKQDPSVAVYPDGEKIGIFGAGEGADDGLFRRESGVGYWDREA